MTEPAVPAVRPDTAHALLHRVARAQVDGRHPSLVAGVVRDSHLVWWAGRGVVDGGPPTTDTQYRIGSITKGMTATLVLRLRDEGLLDLDDRLDAHVEGTGLGDRTLRALLSHTAGLAAEPTGPWWERAPGQPWDEFAAALTPSRILEHGGGRFHYSNVGYALLGRVVERHRGVSWYDALRSELLEPLGMTRTTYTAEPPSAEGLAVHPWADLVLPEPQQDALAMAPAGQLWSTVEDQCRWAAFLAGDAAGVVSAETMAEMRAVRAIAEGAEWTTAYGLGVQIFRVGGATYVGHGGSIPGFLAMVAVDVGSRTGAVLMANSTSGLALSATELLAIVEKHEPPLASAWQPVQAPPDGVVDALGMWFWGPAPYTLRLVGDHTLELTATAGRGRGSRFRRSGDGWVGTENYYDGEPLTVVRRDDGSVSHLDIGTFVFTREPYGPDEPVPGGVDPEGWQPGATGNG